jgi:hypothetical protein
MMFENEYWLLQLLVLQPFFLERSGTVEDVDEAGRIDVGLLDKEECAGLARLERAFDRTFSADHDYLWSWIDRLDLMKKRDAVDVRQLEIEQNNSGTPVLVELFGLRAMAGNADLVARFARGLFDDHLEPLSHHRLVVYDEHAFPLAATSVGRIHASSR